MNDYILNVVTVYVIPFMQLYGLYIIFHGHDSPGGGFAGGMVLGVGMVLYSLVHGLDKGKKLVPKDLAMVGGLIIFFTVLAVLFLGDGFEIGIGFKVALVIVSIFYTLVEEI